MDLMKNILISNSMLSGVSLKENPNSIELLLKQENGKGKMVFHSLFPGLTLAYIYVNTNTWPESEQNSTKKPLLINYCISGRSELLLDDNTYIYLKANEFCISEQSAQKEYIFPTGQYRGIKIYFDMDLLTTSCKDTIEAFHLDLPKIQELYCSKKKTYVNLSEESLRTIFKKLWELAEAPSIFHMKIYTLELIHHLITTGAYTKTCEFYTRTQVEIAKKAQQILTEDLKKHYPIRLLAEQFFISETSLKNYFRGVYGQNISSYLREIRMNAAAKMLSDTQDSIAEISVQVGYANQGKFASKFKQQFNMSPLEYRRTKRLESL